MVGGIRTGSIAGLPENSGPLRPATFPAPAPVAGPQDKPTRQCYVSGT